MGHRLAAFPGSMASAASTLLECLHITSRYIVDRICLVYLPTCLYRDYQRPAQHSLLRPYFAHHIKYRNINLFPINYAFLPRLRGRLTLLRLTYRRKPWTFGVRVFNPHYRYSCQHSLFWYLQLTSQLTFIGLQNAPLPLQLIVVIRSFGVKFSPVTSSVQDDSTSELLRFLLRMAASKPTSWLSMPSYFVSHLILLGDLSWRSGLFPFPLRTLSPAVCLLWNNFTAFGVCIGLVSRYDPLAETVLYLRKSLSQGTT